MMYLSYLWAIPYVHTIMGNPDFSIFHVGKISRNIATQVDLSALWS